MAGSSRIAKLKERLGESDRYKPGMVVDDKYPLGFGISITNRECVFETVLNGKMVAIKIGPQMEMPIITEIIVLAAANDYDLKLTYKMLDFGDWKGNTYFVVDLLGPSIGWLRLCRKHAKFTLSTAVRTAIQTLNALEELHSIGYVSADVKPENFVIGPPGTDDANKMFIIDFGCAAAYWSKDDHGNGIHVKEGYVEALYGSARYCTLNAHALRVQSRKDDLISWFLMIVEFTCGRLPWIICEREDPPNLAAIEHMKKDVLKNVCSNADRAVRDKFLEKCPRQYEEILDILMDLEFASDAPYDLLREKLSAILPPQELDMDSPYDWTGRESPRPLPGLEREEYGVKSRMGNATKVTVSMLNCLKAKTPRKTWKRAHDRGLAVALDDPNKPGSPSQKAVRPSIAKLRALFTKKERGKESDVETDDPNKPGTSAAGRRSASKKRALPGKKEHGKESDVESDDPNKPGTSSEGPKKRSTSKIRALFSRKKK